MTRQEVTWGQAGQKAGEGKEEVAAERAESRPVVSSVPVCPSFPLAALFVARFRDVTSGGTGLGLQVVVPTRKSTDGPPCGGCFLWFPLAVTV